MQSKELKTVVFYYTQSGQALSVARSICEPMEKAGACIVYKEIIPVQQYPYPWSKYEFFDSFPETRLGMPPSGIHQIDLTDADDVDLVIIVGQSWFLSPSLPLQSFFEDTEVRRYLKGRNVLFVNACRNMWLMTGRKVKAYLRDIQAHLVGHIVLQDRHPNLVSALTIVRWLMYGKKGRSFLLPSAGISDADISDCSKFGGIILDGISDGGFSQLQDRLLASGAIDYKPSILFLEKAGHRMFGFWAKFIRRKGGFRDKRRRLRVECFFYYLLFVLFLISPLGQLFFYLTYPLHRVRQHQLEDVNIKD